MCMYEWGGGGEGGRCGKKGAQRESGSGIMDRVKKKRTPKINIMMGGPMYNAM